MNILFIGQFRSAPNDGWNEGTVEDIKALMTTGHNITIRNINMNPVKGPIDPIIEPLERNKYDKYDVVIYKVLPNLLYYDARLGQNIAFSVYETKMKYNRSHWLYKYNMVDKVLVTSSSEQEWLNKEIKQPVYAVGEPIDITIGQKEYKKIENLDEDRFLFYSIGANCTRKNLVGLIKAYLSEFTINDNVGLVIKTSNNLIDQINQIKSSLRRFALNTKYPPIILISDHLNNDLICSLHQHCHCLVVPSYGEAVNRSMVRATIFSTPVICTKNIGTASFLNSSVAYFIDSTEDMVDCVDPPLPDIYNTDENWYIPNILSLRKTMRQAYSDQLLYSQKVKNIQTSNIIQQFSYESVGKNIIDSILQK